VCTALFVAFKLYSILVFAVFGVGGHKVSSQFLAICAAVPRLHFVFATRSAAVFHRLTTLLCSCLQLLALINQSQSRSAGSVRSGAQRAQDHSQTKLRRKLVLMVVAIEGAVFTIFLSSLGVLLVPIVRDRTWLVMPTILSSVTLGGHVALFVTPTYSSRTAKNSSGSACRSSGTKSSPFYPSRLSSRSKPSAHKVSPATSGLLDPIAVLACSQLAVAEPIRNKDEFRQPQEQPRAEKLKWVAGLLQDAMFKKGEHTMNEAIAGVIEEHFIPVAQVHFADCVEQARDMMPKCEIGTMT
jgi:hypothetical protein